MVELSLLIWIMSFFFAYIGFNRGWTKEVISTSGIVLGLFALHQFDQILRTVLLVGLQPGEKFYAQTAIFLAIVFFSYQTRAIVGGDAQRTRAGAEGRDAVQTQVLGAIVGFLNGYLISGSVWYFLHINRISDTVYALEPFVTAPLAGTANAAAVQNLPLFILAGGPGGPGDLLALTVILLFVLVLVVI